MATATINTQSVLPSVGAGENTLERNPWIVGPWFDLLFVCGGLPLLLIGVNVLLIGWRVPFDNSAAAQRTLLILILLGQHMFADAHNAATYMRIWGSEADRKRFSFYRTWLVYSCVPLFAAGLFVPALASAMVYLYLIAVYWHYAAQAFGISLIYCAKRDYYFNSIERRIYKTFFLSLSALVIVRFLSFRELSPSTWFGVPIPFWGPLPPILYRVSAFVFGACLSALAAVLLRKMLLERKAFPLPAVLIVLTILWLGISLGPANGLLWMYVPAFFHGSQYLAVCLTYYVKEREAERGGTVFDIGRLLREQQTLRYLSIVVGTGIALYVAIPYACYELGFDFALSAGLVLAVVNYHHFITDAAIWKLRDSRYKRLLLT